MIGFLHPALPDTYTDRLRAFRQGLKEAGFVEGENVAIEYRWAENQIDRLRRRSFKISHLGPFLRGRAKFLWSS